MDDDEMREIPIGQLRLGELISLLEREDPEKVVPAGFRNPHSYRGYYEQLAFEPAADVTVGAMLEAARSALGATYEGHKGGEYTMDEMTECWLAWEGSGDGETIGHLSLLAMLNMPSGIECRVAYSNRYNAPVGRRVWSPPLKAAFHCSEETGRWHPLPVKLRRGGDAVVEAGR